MALGGITAPGKAAKVATMFLSFEHFFFNGDVTTIQFKLPEPTKIHFTPARARP